jgi:hypothetical protein
MIDADRPALRERFVSSQSGLPLASAGQLPIRRLQRADA